MSNLVKSIDELSAVYRCGYQQGRKDAIDEIINIIDNSNTYYQTDKNENLITPKMLIKDELIKQLKENKNE